MPFVPGFAVLEIGLMVKHWTAHPADMRHLAIDCAALGWVAAVFYALWELNRRAAEKLQTQFDELNALRGG